MQANKLPVCNIGLFNQATDFWMGSIEGLTKRYPAMAVPHINTFYLILIIKSGQGELVVDQQKRSIYASELIILKPNCINTLTLGEETLGTIIGFTTDFFSLRYNTNVLHQFSFLKEAFGTALSLPVDTWNIVQMLSQQMLTEFSSNKKATKKILRSYLNIVLIELDRIYVPTQTIQVHNAVNDKIQKYQLLIEQHFKTHKMPSEYADMLHISTNYLNKISQNITGQTAGNLIKKHIILEAKRLLNYTTNSVSEIANELGFEHASYFVTIFKKATNQTPEQYRRTQLYE